MYFNGEKFFVVVVSLCVKGGVRVGQDICVKILGQHLEHMPSSSSSYAY